MISDDKRSWGGEKYPKPKVFETILNDHFLKHLESSSLLSDHQYGFRRARSTGDLLSYVTSIWSSALKDFGESFVVDLDISKAFDRVWHASLLSKLPSFGFLPSICSLLLDYLSNRSLSVVVDGSVSQINLGSVYHKTHYNNTSYFLNYSILSEL